MRQTLAASISMLAVSRPSNMEESLLTKETLRSKKGKDIISKHMMTLQIKHQQDKKRKKGKPGLASVVLLDQAGLLQKQLQTSGQHMQISLIKKFPTHIFNYLQ